MRHANVWSSLGSVGVWCLTVATCSSAVAKDEWIIGVTAKATSAQVAGLMGPENLMNDRGLKETPAGSGQFALANNDYADNGCMWQSGYLQRGPDENAIVEFDLQVASPVERFRVWNRNAGNHRGFRDVLVTYSVDGKTWGTHLERLTFAKAPQTEDYLGEEYKFVPAIRARYIRFHALSTHRGGGQRDLAGLGKVRFVKSTAATKAVAANKALSVPGDMGYVDVTAPPYLARGDGKTDDTAALQRAVTECQGSGKVLWLPPGTYLVSDAIAYKPGVAFGYNNLRGSGRDKTVVRLKDGTFTDREKPRAVLSWAYNGHEDGSGVHADWFNCNVGDLTIDTGKNNAGAIGLRYYSNNVGAARRIAIRSGDGQGVIGLDLGYADQNGPCLVSDIEVVGFETGISTGATVNSQTLEHVRMRGQTVLAWENKGQCLAIRDLKVSEAAGGFVNQFGIVALVDAKFSGVRGAAKLPAITSRETLFARDIEAQGFARTIENSFEGGTSSPGGSSVIEFVSEKPIAPFGGAATSLRLPVEEVPQWRPESGGGKPFAKWANVLHHRQVEDPDDSAAFQRACDSGAEVVYWPTGVSLLLGEPVNLPATLRRIVGGFSNLHAVKPAEVAMRIVADSQEPLFIDEVHGHVLVEHKAGRTLVVRDCQGVEGKVIGKGDVFLDNAVGEWEFGPGRAWCRQFNTEREGTHCINHGGDLWVLGLKTERGGTLVETREGGRTEILGGLSYTTTQGGLAPMFTAKNAAMSVTIGEVCYSGDPFKTLVEQTVGDTTHIVKRGEAPLRASFLQGSRLPLYVGRPQK
jgi:hypothetical protein